MIDIHSHLIPKLDDGSRSVEQSLATLEQFRADGVTDVILTPHLRASELNVDPEDALERRQAAYAVLQRRAPAEPRLHLGFEIMLDLPLPEAAQDRRFALAETRYYLVEFPLGIVGRFASTALEQVVRSGITPVVAHPERYLACNVRMMSHWREIGAKIQVDATTLTRNSTRGRLARQLVSAGLADVLAADNHGDRRTLKAGAQFLVEAGHPDAADQLTRSNPRAILEDGAVTDCRRVKLKEGMWSRIKGMISE